LAISREKKEELVKSYVEKLKQSKGFILTDYRGLSVGQVEDVRGALRPIEGQFHVVKNRLFSLALEEVEISIPDEILTGPTAASFCYDEVPPVAKALVEAIEDTSLEVKGGLLEHNFLSAEQVKAIAELPSREVLLAQVLGTINAPATQLTGVIANGVRQVLNVLQAYVDKLEESGEASAPAMEQAAEPA
jgi:large subunit ribosomal protein L10